MNRVVVTRGILGAYGMQVCAEADVSDEEVLEVCNRENPAGTEAGWTRVAHEDHEEPKLRPVTCQNDSDRRHLIVTC